MRLRLTPLQIAQDAKLSVHDYSVTEAKGHVWDEKELIFISLWEDTRPRETWERLVAPIRDTRECVPLDAACTCLQGVIGADWCHQPPVISYPVDDGVDQTRVLMLQYVTHQGAPGRERDGQAEMIARCSIRPTAAGLHQSTALGKVALQRERGTASLMSSLLLLLAVIATSVCRGESGLLGKDRKAECMINMDRYQLAVKSSFTLTCCYIIVCPRCLDDVNKCEPVSDRFIGCLEPTVWRVSNADASKNQRTDKQTEGLTICKLAEMDLVYSLKSAETFC